MTDKVIIKKLAINNLDITSFDDGLEEADTGICLWQKENVIKCSIVGVGLSGIVMSFNLSKVRCFQLH